jgi:hypothetical protein
VVKYVIHAGFEVLKRNHREAGSELAPCFTLVSYLAYSSTLKMEAICSSETSVDYQLTTGRYNPGYRILRVIHILGAIRHGCQPARDAVKILNN